MTDVINFLLANVPLYALVVSIGVLAWKAFDYISIRKNELRNRQFERYHQLIQIISTGVNDGIKLKHVSALAYISELQNYPAYKETTEIVLRSLFSDWETKEPNQEIVTELRDVTSATFRKLKLKFLVSKKS